MIMIIPRHCFVKGNESLVRQCQQLSVGCAAGDRSFTGGWGGFQTLSAARHGSRMADSDDQNDGNDDDSEPGSPGPLILRMPSSRRRSPQEAMGDCNERMSGSWPPMLGLL